MNSFVWVSSTSVHSLLRKAGTFELCFIVNEAQEFLILHPNAAVAAEAEAAAAAEAEAVAVAAAAAPRERPQRRRSSSRAPPTSPRPAPPGAQ